MSENNKNDSLLTNESKQLVSQLFKVLSDPTRISIIYALRNKELSVTELTNEVEMTQSSVSHQLRVLRDANLVKYRRNGKEVIYSLADDHVYNIFDQAIEHVEEEGN